MTETTQVEQLDKLPPSLKASVGITADRLQKDYLQRGSTPAGAEARRCLAELRKFAARRVQDSPLALENVLMMLTPSLSDGELGRGEELSRSERAAFHAMSLFGVHMQSANKPMHSTENSFAFACGQLFARSSSKSIKPRFDAMQAAGDEESRIVHLRSLVSLLRAQQLSFDYGRFAQDLRSLSNPSRKNGVLMRWGRDFARGAQNRASTAAENS
ncbi:MAG TPA: type I-E CRISPR-associated protein Cse2/CasB [Candidatus Corynebacterium gallistercoris]|uniref:Type I-E CRISPR-associated protein Cse2/CasB n=1 Tax=Candidatus Corynebacterium gallistercoris TaxID=2838530 RepID=A0A9D1RY77_9CORY|nr:type I-E CRISPR-associated protein Cse2/CasB [Candidatus Corynebacterium gallistercoris]